MASRPGAEPLLTAGQIARGVADLAARLSADYADSRPILLVVLKGSFYFGADLARAMRSPVEVDFIRAKSYLGTVSGEAVELELYPRATLTGRDVLIVEDILDSGQTASRLMRWVEEQEPASLRLCALLDKPEAREVPVKADYVGFTIPDSFVVGYGLDYQERYRELPAIHRLNHDE